MVDIAAPEKKPDTPDPIHSERNDSKKTTEKNSKSGKENTINGSAKAPKTNNLRSASSKKSEGKESEFIHNLETQMNSDEEPPHPNIMALAAACGDNILNPEYLLGSGEPFSSRSSSSSGNECFSHGTANGTSVVPDLTADPGLDLDSTTSFLPVCSFAFCFYTG